MNKREVVQTVLNGGKPPYTPWSFRFTAEPMADLCKHYACPADELIAHTGRHILELGSDIGFFEDLGGDRHRDAFGVVWNRGINKDIEAPESYPLGDPDELFDDLIGIGLNCFNPFQPEVMDVAALHARYHHRLAFWGGLSTQITLPRGSAAEVRDESERLLSMGLAGGYIFSPAHSVQNNVPLDNILTFIETAQTQAHAPES